MADVFTSQALPSGYNSTSFAKPVVTTAGSSGAWTTANSPITLFTVTGTVIARCYGVATTALTSTSSTGTLSLGVPGTAAFIGTSTVNGTNFILNAAWVTTASTTTAVGLGTNPWVLTTGNIIINIGTNNMTAGGMTIICDWIPVTAGATVVAVAP